MSTPAYEVGAEADPLPPRIRKRVVAAWGLWDWGSSAYNAVIVSFVFGPYLTRAVAADRPEGSLSGSTWLGISTALAGLVIALMAPVTGQRADAGGRRKRSLGIWTALVIVVMFSLFFVKQDYDYLWLGLVLLGLGSIFSEFAGVSYNAMLQQVSTPANIGRISGFGWSMGYFGGIFLLLLCFVGFISPETGWFGASDVEGLRFRLVAVFAAVWFLVFAVPVMIAVPEIPPAAASRRVGFFASYRILLTDLRALYRTYRNAVYFLAASALYRDGLSAVFTFGAILAVSVYGLAPGDVLIFGVAANIVAAFGALSAGFFEDRLGPKPVIMVSLVGLVATAVTLLFLSGPTMFWIFGLLLCLWVGPAQASSRAYLARLAPKGREGQMFGLYATTGRAVSFLAPGLFALFTGIFASDRPGIIGIALVLAAGAVALYFVKPPAHIQPDPPEVTNPPPVNVSN